MRSTLLWGLIPDEAIPLLIVGAALLSIIVGRRVLGFIIPLVISILLAPFVESLMASLPWWMTLLMLLALGLALLRGALGLFLGDRATGHLVGALATDVVHFMLKAVVAVPVFLVRSLLRIIASARNAEVDR